MTIEIGFALSFLVAVIGAVYGYGRLSKQVEAHDDENEKMWKVIGSVRDAWENHEKDSAVIRLEFSRRLSDAEASDKVSAVQYGETLRRLDDLKALFLSRFDELKKEISDLRSRE